MDYLDQKFCNVDINKILKPSYLDLKASNQDVNTYRTQFGHF